jgi:hypothetical protein
MKQLNRLELSINAKELEDESVDFAVKMDAGCTINFLGNAFVRLMEQDKMIKEAMHLAVLNGFLESMGDDLKDKLNREASNLFSKNQPKAQA